MNFSKFIIFVFIIASTSNVYASTSKSFPFSDGEKIIYSIKKFGIKTGEATLIFKGIEKVEDRDVYLIVFTADGPNFFDEERIYVDPLTFSPIRVDRDLNIFGRKEKITEDYDTEKGCVRITKTVKGKVSEQTIEKEGVLDNIYGFIYRYRKNGKFEIDDVLEINLPTKDVDIHVVKKSKLKVAKKVYEAFYLRSKPRKYKLWFDSGENKIPLRIDGAVGFGNTSMIMIEYQK